MRHTVKYFCGTRDFPDVKIIASLSSGRKEKNITEKIVRLRHDHIASARLRQKVVSQTLKIVLSQVLGFLPEFSENFVTAKSGNNKVLEWNFFLLRGHW